MLDLPRFNAVFITNQYLIEYLPFPFLPFIMDSLSPFITWPFITIYYEPPKFDK